MVYIWFIVVQHSLHWEDCVSTATKQNDDDDDGKKTINKDTTSIENFIQTKDHKRRSIFC